jgi:hypothetical protein
MNVLGRMKDNQSVTNCLEWMCGVWHNLILILVLYALCAENASGSVRLEEAEPGDPTIRGAAAIGETAELDWRSVPWEVAMHWNETSVYCEPHSALNINRASCTLRREINSWQFCKSMLSYWRHSEMEGKNSASQGRMEFQNMSPTSQRPFSIV